MANLTVVYWRDIPAQVIVREGRRTERRELPQRFIAAIDSAAMRADQTGTDAYLEAWRRSEPMTVDGDAAEAADSAVARLEQEYPNERLRALIANGGHAPDPETANPEKESS